MAELGATDIPRLRELGLERLEVLLGNHGRSLWLLACGEDPKPLRVKRHPATLSREETLPGSDPNGLLASLTRLASSLEQALKREGLHARRIALRVTYMDERTVTRSRSLRSPVSEASQLISAAQGLLAKIEADGEAVRRSGLVLRGLEISGATDRQLDLF